ncbi:MAG: O-antigen ligase family protein [Thermotogae bacterium]|nr:O-antigen ligase family protein [Thermotogota bacterium]
MRRQSVLYAAAIAMAAVLPFSLSLSYVPLSVALVVALSMRRLPKDFLLFVLLYVWRGITLLANGLPIKPLRDLYDKTGYVAFSPLRLTARRFNALMLTLALSSSAVALLGILAAFTGLFRTGWIYTSCLGNCQLRVKRTTEIKAVVLTNRERNRFVGGPRLTYDSPATLEPGEYTFHSYAGAIVKVRRKDVVLGEGWVGAYGERRFFRFNSFVGFYDHKMHSGAVFGILSVLFSSLGLFYSPLYLIFALLTLIATLLSGAKAYIFATLSAVLGVAYLRVGRLRELPKVLAGISLVGAAVLLHSPLREGFLWSAKARMSFWRIGVETFTKSPIFGIGYDNISQILEPYHAKGIVDNAAHLHSSYLNALAETGVVGFILSIAIMLYFIILFLRWAFEEEGFRRAYLLGVFLSLLVVALVGLVESNYDTAILNLLLTFLMGIGRALKWNI